MLAETPKGGPHSYSANNWSHGNDHGRGFHLRLRISEFGMVAAMILVCALFIGSRPALADAGSGLEDPDPTAEGNGRMETGFNKGFDVLIMRPLGAAALVTGAVFFVPAVLLSAPGGREGIDDAYDVLVKTPWSDVAERPLGDL